ncbi:hypothetical protein BDW22DRAFT_708745 [Trametopsis cervina]|nr:hypothetical protein BDW22DRAFT_708745 [Trametopsis cervina]
MSPSFRHQLFFLAARYLQTRLPASHHCRPESSSRSMNDPRFPLSTNIPRLFDLFSPCLFASSGVGTQIALECS